MSEAWISARIERDQRDMIDTLVERGKYASRSEFIRSAIRQQINLDLQMDVKMLEQGVKKDASTN